jgi:hypothetical protein
LIRTFELGLSKGLMLLVVSFETPGKWYLFVSDDEVLSPWRTQL